MPISLTSSVKSLFLLLAVLVSIYALGYDWINAQDTNGIAVKFKRLNNIFVYGHLIGGAFALTLGALQLFNRQGSRWHRHLGISYCLAVLIAGISGSYLSFFADVGPSAGVGFFILAVMWLYTTYTAYGYARNHQLSQHRRWTIRSLAITATAISLRVELFVFTQFWSFETSYILVAWCSWIGNLLLAELYLSMTSRTITVPKGNFSL